MTQPRWLSPAEDRAWRGYRRMRALLDLRISQDLLADSGLSDADYDVLSALSETDGHRLRIKELAGRMLWSSSRLSHHISRMQQRGLVVREAYPADGRGALVVLTPEGLQTIRRAAPEHVESVRRAFVDVLTDDQIDCLGTVAEAVIRRLSSPS